MFESIVKEEMEHSKVEEEDDDGAFPTFGDSQSDYDTVSQYCTNQIQTKLFAPQEIFFCTQVYLNPHLLFPGGAHLLRLLAELLHAQELCLEGGIWHTAGLQPLGEKGHGEREQEDQREGSQGAQRARQAACGLRPQTRPARSGSQEACGGAERWEGQKDGGDEAKAETQPGQVSEGRTEDWIWDISYGVLCLIISCPHPRLAEEYKEQSWAAMSELEKELQQMEAQYGQEFGDASESEEEENSDVGGQLNFCTWCFYFGSFATVASFCFCIIYFIHKYWFADSEQPDEDEVTIDDYYDDLYCPACDKSFKSDKAWVMFSVSWLCRSVIAVLFETSC